MSVSSLPATFTMKSQSYTLPPKDRSHGDTPSSIGNLYTCVKETNPYTGHVCEPEEKISHTSGSFTYGTDSKAFRYSGSISPLDRELITSLSAREIRATSAMTNHSAPSPSHTPLSYSVSQLSTTEAQWKQRCFLARELRSRDKEIIDMFSFISKERKEWASDRKKLLDLEDSYCILTNELKSTKERNKQQSYILSFLGEQQQAKELAIQLEETHDILDKLSDKTASVIRHAEVMRAHNDQLKHIIHMLTK